MDIQFSQELPPRLSFTPDDIVGQGLSFNMQGIVSDHSSFPSISAFSKKLQPQPQALVLFA
ncbi:hypothetical protein N7451_005965 [Penicillium sp. IBT 35674x]|nr:hypothetical protein N7451_005965 [Penicillium sp. IBT 35674x]